MWSSRQSASSFWRSTGAAWIALVVALGISFLPLPAKNGLAAVLERSVFSPFRLAVGWGPRSLVSAARVARLAREATQERVDSDQARDMAAENLRLRRLLGFRRRADLELIPAAVVARSRARVGDLLVIEPADPSAVVPGLPVVGPEGLLGRISQVWGGSARVECLTHENVAVSVRNARNWEGGIAKWSPESGGMVIEGVPSQADWQVGDRLVTSGLGAAFPRGLLVGWVAGQRGEGGGLLKTIRVRAAAAAGRVDEVFILHVSTASLLPDGGADAGALYPSDPASRRRIPFLAAVGPDPGPVAVP